MLNMESYRDIIDGEGRMQWGSEDQTSLGLLKPPRYKILKNAKIQKCSIPWILNLIRYRKDTEPFYHSFMYLLVSLLSGIYPLPAAIRDSGNDFWVPEIGLDSSRFSFILLAEMHVVSGRFFWEQLGTKSFLFEYPRNKKWQVISTISACNAFIASYIIKNIFETLFSKIFFVQIFKYSKSTTQFKVRRSSVREYAVWLLNQAIVFYIFNF